MKYLLVILISLVIFSCEFSKKNLTPAKPALEGRWLHIPSLNENENETPQIRPEYNLAIFTDSTYYLTCKSPFSHSSGNIITKEDTLILYKNDISARDLAFIYELKIDELILNPIDDKINLKNKDIIGLWKRD